MYVFVCGETGLSSHIKIGSGGLTVFLLHIPALTGSSLCRAAKGVKLKILGYDFTWWQKTVKNVRDEEVFKILCQFSAYLLGLTYFQGLLQLYLVLSFPFSSNCVIFEINILSALQKK